MTRSQLLDCHDWERVRILRQARKALERLSSDDLLLTLQYTAKLRDQPKSRGSKEVRGPYGS